MLGISISSFAYPLVVLDETGSPARAGLVGSVLVGTAFFLGLPAGMLADRWNRRGALGGTAFLLAPAVNTIVFAEGARDELQGRVTSAGINSRASARRSGRSSPGCCSARSARRGRSSSTAARCSCSPPLRR
jgi:hypothetical protein